ncbi:MAG: DNA-directed RNA polymerase subunit omega [Candidatus Manganitrophaceae bacterium]|nr:MAG: DNA-directed RNA polymerase subunit omega [Candidatus Manganitrophaceae bacterium]
MEIISLPVETDYSKIDSRYRLVIIASQRARQLMEGARPILQTRHNKASTIALEEVLGDELEVLYGKEAKQAQREAKRLREEMKTRQLLSEREEELATEIRKDLSVYLEESAKRQEPPPAPEVTKEE